MAPLPLLALLLMAPQGLPPARSLETGPGLRERSDWSAVVAVPGGFVAADDEGARLWPLRLDAEAGRLELRGKPWRLPVPESEEADLEALAWDGSRLWAAGSHSRVRRRLREDRSPAENRERLREPRDEPWRRRVWRLAPDGSRTEEAFSLDPLLAADPVLSPFLAIPGKENGVDVEALAWREESLWFGFRSPVLRGHLAPVLRTTPAGEARALLWLDLGGGGLRALETVEGGFLLISGPPRDVSGDFHLWFWSGEDATPGRGQETGRILRRLGTLPSGAGRPEGLALHRSGPSWWEVLVLHDGVPGGAPALLRVPRPR